MTRATVIFVLSVAAAQGSTLDGGSVLTPAYFVPDSTPIFLEGLSSTDGQFSLLGSTLGGANLDCAFVNLPLGCQFGGIYSIQAMFPDASSSAASATAIIDGNPVDSLLLACPTSECPRTSISLTAAPVLISGPGSYSVPFTATGQIQASTGFGLPLILDQTVSGVGLLDFSVSQSSSGWFVFDTNGPNHASLQWNFVSVPEPAMTWAFLLGLAVIWWKEPRLRRQLERGTT